ncbi:hypothetical protein AB0I84_09505 [Streptomyces spectabilis]|uniref:hypothetical protein n=1 Tax=Streptomyces spectabilis TaxID=68270 RepID=UPI0033FC54D5
MRYEITAPHQGDEHVADVSFVGGRATVTDPGPGLLLYFQRHGYTLASLGDDPPDPPPTAENGPSTTKTAGRSAARTKRG